MESSNWRTRLPQESRQRVVNIIIDKSMKRLTSHGPQEVVKMEGIASRFERKIFSTATSQEDYERKISWKLSSLEAQTRQTGASSSSSGPAFVENSAIKIKTLRELCLPELKELYKKISIEMEEIDSNPQHPRRDGYEKLKEIESLWKKAYAFLHFPKSEISLDLERSFSECEKLIHKLLRFNGPKRSISSVQQERLSWSDEQSLQHPFQPQFRNDKVLSNGNQTPEKNLQNYTSSSQSEGNEPWQKVSHIELHTNMLQSVRLQPQKEQKIIKAQQAKQQFEKQQMRNQLMPQKEQTEVQNHQQAAKLPGMGNKAGNSRQHHSVGMFSVNNNPHSVKAEPPYPISAPRLLQIESSQIPQPCTHQIDQKILQKSFIDSESRLNSPNSVNTSIVISASALSPLRLLAESDDVDGNHNHVSTTGVCEQRDTEGPFQKLIKVVRSMSYKALISSVSDIDSVGRMVDRTAGSIPGNGSRSAIGEDLVAETNSRLQVGELDWNSRCMKMRCCAREMSSSIAASDSIADSFNELTDPDKCDNQSTLTSHNKRPRLEVNFTLLEEIREINWRLIDTVLDISEECVKSTGATSVTEDGDGTIVKCSFNAVTVNPNMNSFPILPLRLLVPRNYPYCSPVLLDKLAEEVSAEYEDLLEKAKSKLSLVIRTLLQPLSLGEIAKNWDICARAAISEYAQQNGGGTFSSRYGTWENLLNAS